MQWNDHVNKWKECQRCPLAQQRSNICLARGTLPADVAFIGEAPGVSEDTMGRPFVGPAGVLLDQIAERALDVSVRRVFANLVACFPRDAKTRGENKPERSEILDCRPRLVELINLTQPRLIVRVGSLVQQYCGFDTSIPYVDIVHPAHILRMPAAQQQMAANKCIVQVRSGWERVSEAQPSVWKPWGGKYAEVE